MKKSRLLWALVLLAAGALLGLNVARGLVSTSGVFVAQRGIERIAVPGRSAIPGERSITIEVPVTAVPPDMPDFPRESLDPEIRWASPETQRIVVQRDVRDSINVDLVLRLVTSFLRTLANLAALLIIVVGAVLLLRQSRQPKEKSPASG